MFNYSSDNRIICRISTGKLLQDVGYIAIKVKDSYAKSDYASIHKYSNLLGSYALELSLRGWSITSIVRWAYNRSNVAEESYDLRKIMDYSYINWDDEPEYENYGCGYWEFWKD